MAAVATVTIGITGYVAEATSARVAARVDISQWAKEGQNGTTLLNLRAKCQSGHVVQQLVMGYSQGDVDYDQPTQVDLVCDGRWHRLRVSAPGGLEPGPADVTARLTVIDAVTGVAAPQAVDTQRVWVEPAAKVAVKRHVRLNDDGTASVTAFVRCDQPWIVQELVLSLTQGAGGGSAFQTDGIACDDRWHTVVLNITPGQVPFSAGEAQVQAYFTVLDPLSFDPVAQAQATATVRLRRPSSG